MTRAEPVPPLRTAGRPSARPSLGPRTRKAVLSAHVGVSVGWLGVEAVQVLLGLWALALDDVQRVRAAYLVMELVGTALVPPVALVSLITGLVLGLGTRWTVLGHYWVLVKLGINVSLIVAGHQLFKSWLRTQASAALHDPTHLQGPRTLSAVLVAGLITALGLLVTATVVSVHKPWGRTPWWERRRRDRAASQDWAVRKPIRVWDDPSGATNGGSSSASRADRRTVP
jgi:hypothetical protein